MRLAGQAKGGFYPTPPRVSDRIGRLIYGSWMDCGFKERENHTLRVLDPCCGDAEAVTRMVQHLDMERNMGHEIYGIELHKERSAIAMEKLDKIMAVDFFASAIGNESFSILFLNPPYDEDNEDGRVEHAFLVKATRYLKHNGILVFIIPRSKLAVSARYLSLNYRGIDTYYFPEPEREQFDQIVVVAYRGSDRAMAPSVEQSLNMYATYKEPPALTMEIRGNKFMAGPVPKDDFMWTTLHLDKDTMFTESRRAGLWARTELMETLAPVNIQRERPLMPLRKGHMGMLIAAGFLNNLTLENDSGERVLVKGKTVKKMELVDENEQTDTYREKMSTSVLALDLNSGEMITVV